MMHLLCFVLEVRYPLEVGTLENREDVEEGNRPVKSDLRFPHSSPQHMGQKKGGLLPFCNPL